MPPRILAALVATLAVAACSDRPRELAQPDGPVFRLNLARWAEQAAAIPGAAPAVSTPLVVVR